MNNIENKPSPAFVAHLQRILKVSPKRADEAADRMQHSLQKQGITWADAVNQVPGGETALLTMAHDIYNQVGTKKTAREQKQPLPQQPNTPVIGKLINVDQQVPKASIQPVQPQPTVSRKPTDLENLLSNFSNTNYFH